MMQSSHQLCITATCVQTNLGGIPRREKPSFSSSQKRLRFCDMLKNHGSFYVYTVERRSAITSDS